MYKIHVLMPSTLFKKNVLPISQPPFFGASHGHSICHLLQSATMNDSINNAAIRQLFFFFCFFDTAYKLTYIAKVCACASKSFLYFYFFSKLFCNFYYFTSIHCPKLSRNANVLRVNDFFVIATHATGRTTLRTPYNMVRSKNIFFRRIVANRILATN